MCALSLSGCVVPPTLEEAPPAPNEPPVIITDSQDYPIDPPDYSVLLCGDDDLNVDIPVEDPDDDPLQMRLFLDNVRVRTLTDTNQGVRYLNAGLPGPCRDVTVRSGRLLEAIISDRGFESDGRETSAEAGIATLARLLDCRRPEDCAPLTDGGR